MSSKKILLIEDNPDIHLMIKYVLMRVGFELYSAYDGVEGLEKIREINPDLIILDLMMPRMGGEEVFAHLMEDKEFEDYRAIPVIMLTARVTPQHKVDELLEKGLAAFLSKPFGQPELINVIQNILTTHRIQHQNRELLKATQEAKDFLAKLVDSIPDALFILDPEGKITYYNGGVNAELGYAPDALNGKSFSSVIADKKITLQEILERLDKEEKLSNLEISLFNHKKQSVPFRLSASCLKNQKGESIGFIFIGSNISELKRLEQELIEKEKLAIFTETAIAVNHEINNPLSPILGNAQMLLQNADNLDEDTVKRLQAIYKNAQRIQKITQKLRQIRHPVQKVYVGKTTMVDIHHSE